MCKYGHKCSVGKRCTAHCNAFGHHNSFPIESNMGLDCLWETTPCFVQRIDPSIKGGTVVMVHWSIESLKYIGCTVHTAHWCKALYWCNLVHWCIGDLVRWCILCSGGVTHRLGWCTSLPRKANWLMRSIPCVLAQSQHCTLWDHE